MQASFFGIRFRATDGQNHSGSIANCTFGNMHTGCLNDSSNCSLAISDSTFGNCSNGLNLALELPRQYTLTNTQIVDNANAGVVVQYAQKVVNPIACFGQTFICDNDLDGSITDDCPAVLPPECHCRRSCSQG